MIALNSDTLAAIAAIVVAVILGVVAWGYSGRRKRSVDPDEVVTIARFGSETEAAEWKMRLRQFGIESSTYGNNFARGYATYGTRLSGHALQVTAGNAQKAISILRESGCKDVQ